MTAVRTGDEPPTGTDRPRSAHYGALRALVSLPAVGVSLGLLLVLCAPAGGWEGLVLLGWIAAGGVLCVRPGERVAVRLACGFRRPTAAERELLSPAWACALDRAHMNDRDVDLYVQRSRQINAFAAGGHSVAVTTAILERRRQGQLGFEQLVALLVHELGHHATRATRWSLTSSLLAAPWRLVCRLGITIGAGSSHGRRRPTLFLAAALGGAILALIQQGALGHWRSAAGLAGLIACTIVCPLADAAISRRSEFAADAFATRAGLGPQLSDALQNMHGPPGQGLLAGALAHHPSSEGRVRAIASAQQAPRGTRALNSAPPPGPLRPDFRPRRRFEPL